MSHLLPLVVDLVRWVLIHTGVKTRESYVMVGVKGVKKEMVEKEREKREKQLCKKMRGMMPRKRENSRKLTAVDLFWQP